VDAIPAHHLRFDLDWPRFGTERGVEVLPALHCLPQVNGAGISHPLMFGLGAENNVRVPRLARPLTAQQQTASV